MAIDKNKKELASEIMIDKGIEHDDWLNNQYEIMINDNIKLLTESLRSNRLNSELDKNS